MVIETFFMCIFKVLWGVENTIGEWKVFVKITFEMAQNRRLFYVYIQSTTGVWKVFAKKCDNSTYRSINLKDYPK